MAVAQVLALQATAGNRACARVLAREPISNHVERHPAPGPLDLQREDDAVESNNRRLDALSIRAVQAILARPATGAIVPEDVQAIARLAPSERSGVLKGPVLDALVRLAARTGMHDEAIHVVARLFRLDIAAALSVRFDPGMTINANVGFEGPLQFITVGPHAFGSAKQLHDLIVMQLDTANPLAAAQPSPFLRKIPRLLTGDQTADAVAFNQRKQRDARAIQAVQVDVLADISKVHDHQTAQFIAEAQNRMRMVPTGKLDREMFDAVFLHRSAAGDSNAAIRLAVDYFRLDNDAVLDVVFDANLAEVCQSRSAGKGAPVTLTFGPPLFGAGTDFAVRKIANFYEQARANLTGATGGRKFLGAAEEVLNRRLGPEDFTAFMWAARDALDEFEKLSPTDQLGLWPRFEELRGEVRDRYRPAPLRDRQQFKWVFEKLEAVARPHA
jgi:hypothetical protein